MELETERLSAPGGPPTSSTASMAVERKQVSPARSLAIVAIPIALLLWGKYQLLQRGGGRIFARLDTFSPLEQLSFFRSDLLVGLIIIPLITLLLAWVLGRWRTIVLAVVSIAAIWLLAIEFQTHLAVGRFLSMQLIEDAIGFARAEANIAGQYITRDAVLKPVVASLAVIAAAWWASGTTRSRTDRHLLRSRFGIAVLAMVILLIIGVTTVAWSPWTNGLPMQRGIITALIQGFREFRDPKLEAELQQLTPQQLHARFMQFSNTPSPLAKPAFFGEARGCDVINIVLETCPAAVTETLTDGDMPYLTQLKRRAWVANRHHSSFPYTSYAMWSILSSWYPSSANLNYPDAAPDRDYPGMMQSLKASGYATGLYAPDLFTHDEDRMMYARLGVEKQYYAYQHSAPHTARYGWETEPIDDLKRRDTMALQEMLRDITQWHRSDRRFIAHFAPQIGHAPWPDLTGGTARTVADRGREIIRFQDEYIGQVVQHLEALGRLDKTIILVTGDHGVRSRREDQTFRAGMIDQYSFHVPLVLHCPAVLKQRQDINHMTSHIDLAPSVLDLLGVSVARTTEQGAPLWDTRLADRTTYFFGNSYLEADGYHSDGTYVMWKRSDDLVFRSSKLSFNNKDAVSDGPDRDAVRHNLKTLNAMRRVWVKLAPESKKTWKGETALAK